MLEDNRFADIHRIWDGVGGGCSVFPHIKAPGYKVKEWKDYIEIDLTNPGRVDPLAEAIKNSIIIYKRGNNCINKR